MLKLIVILKWIFHSIQNGFLKIFVELNGGHFRARKQKFNTKQKRSVFDVNTELMTIPFCKGLPLVGTLFDLMSTGGSSQLHKYINKRHDELGPIFRERLGGSEPLVFVASANLMRSVFLHEGQHPRHPLPDSWMLYNKDQNCQRGLFFMEGTEWYHNRRILNRLLLNGNLNWMDKHIQFSTDQFVAKLKKCLQNGEHYEIENLEHKLYRWSINVICAIMFGPAVIVNPDIVELIKNFTRIVHKIFTTSAVLMNFPPSIAKMLNLKMWCEFEQNVKEVLHTGSNLIERFMELVALEDNQMALQYRKTETLFQKLQAASMPMDIIKRVFVDLVIAAGDTTAFASQWTLYILSTNPDIQENIVNLCKQGNENSSYVQGLIKETLRLYPVAPFIGRYLANDAVIGGYHIKKDTLVLLSLYTAGRDAAHFPDPLVVKPDRWERNSETGKLSGVSEAHGTLPFAIGSRSCIGRRIAISQLNFLITAFADNFLIECRNQTPVDTILRMVTVPSQTLQLSIKLRSKFGNM